MIISRTPLRMSFVGGGSDLTSFYQDEPGAVVSTTIKRYIYITVNDRFESGIRLGYSKTEIIQRVEDIQHKLIRAVLKKLSIDGGIEITTMADVPSHGTGLGSSSSFTVGLLNAMHTYKNEFSSAESLAQESCEIEIVYCKDPIGKQDQYIAAYGGLKFIQFNPDESVYIDPIICLQETIDHLQNNLLVFYTGHTRNAAEILKVQIENIKSDSNKKSVLKKMVKLAFNLKEELQNNRLDAFGEILHENWVLKTQLATGITNPEINEWYEKARNAGALGGKLLGAGGGGFMIFYAAQEKHNCIIRALHGLRKVDMPFEKQGSKIIFIH